MAIFTDQISFLYRHLVRPAFFLLDPETIHDLMIQTGETLGKYTFTKSLTRTFFRYDHPALTQTLHGITFTNPVGLSCGFDKFAQMPTIAPDVGFGFTQVGSVTWKAYDGNPKPRLFRLPKSKGLVVYYGLKSPGVAAIADKLKGFDFADFPVSISVAMTNDKSTSTEAGGIEDYYQVLKHLVRHQIGSFYTINISCPNTFGGEPFTTAPKLNRLLTKLKTVKTAKPIFVKMPINLKWKDFDALLKVIVKHNHAGVIIGNLTKVRDPQLIKDDIPSHVKGGISGRPTYKLSNDLIAKTYRAYGDKLTIIGVGGIFDAKDAYEKIKLGASMVQLITGMIYGGPQTIGQINRDLVDLLHRDGYRNIKEAIGTHHQ